MYETLFLIPFLYQWTFSPMQSPFHYSRIHILSLLSAYCMMSLQPLHNVMCYVHSTEQLCMQPFVVLLCYKLRIIISFSEKVCEFKLGVHCNTIFSVFVSQS